MYSVVESGDRDGDTKFVVLIPKKERRSRVLKTTEEVSNTVK
jgi:hypothetical protein